MAYWVVELSLFPEMGAAGSEVAGVSRGRRYAMRLDWFAFKIIVSGRTFEGISSGFDQLKGEEGSC